MTVAAGVTLPSDEPALVEGLRRGDAQAFETLIRTHAGRLIRVAQRILGNEEDARDAVQEAFISAYKSRQQFNADSKIGTWLHRIAINAALMKLRTKRRHPEESIDDLEPRFLPTGKHLEKFVSWEQPVDEMLAQKETASFVRAAIDELPEAYRTVLLIRDIEGFSNQEAAEILGTTTNAVKIRLHRARMALRSLLAPRMGAVRS
jgi:RNA polymerase sigma-70 factor (ECF subfamily)